MKTWNGLWDCGLWWPSSSWVGGFCVGRRRRIIGWWEEGAKFQKETPVGLYLERPLISLLLATLLNLSASWKSASPCKLLYPLIYIPHHTWTWMISIYAPYCFLYFHPFILDEGNDMHAQPKYAFQRNFLFMLILSSETVGALHHWCMHSNDSLTHKLSIYNGQLWILIIYLE